MEATKKFEPNRRSNINRNSATVMTGMANSNRNCVTSVIQVNTGSLNQVMPGARRLSTVTMRFTAETSDAIPVMSRPRA